MKRVVVPFAAFFCVLCGYFVLRPVRDEIGVRAGVEKLPWLFTGTFLATLLLVPLFGWIVSRVPRRIIASATYALCAAALLMTYAGLQNGGSLIAWGVGLFIGISVLNLFLISVFWSLMADSDDVGEARRPYGIVAAGGAAGAIAGPSITASLAPLVGPMNLLPSSAGRGASVVSSSAAVVTNVFVAERKASSLRAEALVPKSPRHCARCASRSSSSS